MDWIVSILDLLRELPKNEESKVIRYQLTKSCTSSGANYRAACRPKSVNDMINKLKIVEEELDESLFWLELINRRFPGLQVKRQAMENNELLSIIVSSINTLKNRKSKIVN